MTRRVLVVEDQQEVARTVCRMLERSGYTIAGTASSGSDAIQKAVDTSPDLVLMDISLRGAMDGAEAALQIRRRVGVPIIYLTGHADDPTLERAKRAEPAGYLLKPVGVQELHSAITMALHNARVRQGETAPRDGEQAKDEELPALAEQLWQAAVNYFERWTVYDNAVRRADERSDGGVPEEGARTLVVLAEHELRRSTEVFGERFGAATIGLGDREARAAQAMWSASEQYFRESARRDELTRKFQQRQVPLADVERACTLATFAQEKLRDAATRFRHSAHLASWSAE